LRGDHANCYWWVWFLFFCWRALARKFYLSLPLMEKEFLSSEICWSLLLWIFTWIHLWIKPHMEGLNKVGVLIMVWRMGWKIYGPCIFHDSTKPQL
jgi:hypothetical protein